MQERILVPFEQTYVLYNPNDVVSMVSVQFTLLPIYIMVFYTSRFLITREIEPVLVVGGHLVNECINQVVKHYMKQPRPDFHVSFGLNSMALLYGMPSAHSQFTGFFVAYFGAIILVYMTHLKRWQKTSGCFMLIFIAITVPFSRVYLGYHTVEQATVGVLIGFTLGLIYFTIVSFCRDVGLIDMVLDFKIAKSFYIKDSYFHNYTTFKQEFEDYVTKKSSANPCKRIDSKKKI